MWENDVLVEFLLSRVLKTPAFKIVEINSYLKSLPHSSQGTVASLVPLPHSLFLFLCRLSSLRRGVLYTPQTSQVRSLAPGIMICWWKQRHERGDCHNKAGYTAIRCVLAGTDSTFGQKRHFCMVSTRVWPTDGRTDGRTDRRTDGPTDGHTLL